MRRLLIVALAVAAVVGLLYAATLSQAGFTCEACVVFNGRRACRAVAAATRSEAEQMAHTTACSLVAQGVTDDLRCQRTEPVSLACRER